MNMEKTAVWIWVSLLLFYPLSFAAAEDQTLLKPHVSVLPAENASGLPSFDAGAKASFDTVMLTLRQAGLYELVPWTGTVPPMKNPQAWVEAAEKRSLDYVVAVRLEKAEGNTVKCRIAVFDRSAGRFSFDKSSQPTELIDIFDASDSTVAEVFTAMTGRHIGFGSIVLKNSGEKGSYRVFLDRNPVRESELAKVLAGTHDIRIIQTRMLGDQAWAARIQVEDRQTVSVPFDIPYLTDAEAAKVAEKKRAVDQLWDNPTAGVKMDQALNEWEGLFTDVSYSPRLAELKKEVQAKRAAWPGRQKELASRNNPPPAAPVDHPSESDGKRDVADISAGLSTAVVFQEDFQSMENASAFQSMDTTVHLSQVRVTGFVDISRYFSLALGYRRVVGTINYDAKFNYSGSESTYSMSSSGGTIWWLDFASEFKLPLIINKDWIISPKLGLEYSRFLGGDVPNSVITDQDRDELSPFYVELGFDLDYYLTSQWFIRLPFSVGMSLNSRQSDSYYENQNGSGTTYINSHNYSLMAGLALGYTF